MAHELNKAHQQWRLPIRNANSIEELREVVDQHSPETPTPKLGGYLVPVNRAEASEIIAELRLLQLIAKRTATLLKQEEIQKSYGQG